MSYLDKLNPQESHRWSYKSLFNFPSKDTQALLFQNALGVTGQIEAMPSNLKIVWMGKEFYKCIVIRKVIKYCLT